jgi:hypothetical protein
MMQGSTHTIQLNAVAPLSPELISSLTFQVFKVGVSLPFISKTVGNGIVLVDEHWIITLSADDLNISGEVERRIKFTSDGKDYINKYGYSNVEATK